MGNSVASIQYIASILKKKKLCLDTSPLTNGYNKAERVWNVAKLKFTIKDNIPRNTTPLVPSLDVLLDVFYKETDNTEEITKKVREILQSKSALHRRLVDAFPKLQAVKIKIKDQTEKIKKEAIRQKEEIETKVEDTTKAIAEKVSNVSITGKKKKQIKEENEK